MNEECGIAHMAAFAAYDVATVIDGVRQTDYFVTNVVTDCAGDPRDPIQIKARRSAREAEDRAHADLFRDIIGNPFRPVAFDPAWRTETAVGLAERMYDSRDFSTMPVLADALEDAGCDHPDMLAHCRGGGPHVRGCWVIDLVLGKA